MTLPRVSLFQSAMRMRLTYGVLPERHVFVQAFSDDVGLERHYHITNCPRVGTAEYSCAALWDEVCIATQQWMSEPKYPGDLSPDEAGHWASAVLQALGIEWV